jgi:iron complex outermembrane receptor protein
MKRTTLWIAILAAFTSNVSHAAGDSLDELSLEDLVKTDITSVARKSQSLADVPAAAFVITAEDIRRSGARALPDVLRMAPGIQVAQIDNGRYAVTARGFNGRFATKLQVLVDGRSLYHSLFGGVMWELDPIPLEDIERIEIIRGAGAVMWGANAVNGVINIISKHSAQPDRYCSHRIRRHQGHRRLLCPHSARPSATTRAGNCRPRHATSNPRGNM